MKFFSSFLLFLWSTIDVLTKVFFSCLLLLWSTFLPFSNLEQTKECKDEEVLNCYENEEIFHTSLRSPKHTTQQVIKAKHLESLSCSPWKSLILKYTVRLFSCLQREKWILTSTTRLRKIYWAVKVLILREWPLSGWMSLLVSQLQLKVCWKLNESISCSFFSMLFQFLSKCKVYMYYTCV